MPGIRTMDGHERLLVLDEETGGLWTRGWPATYRNIVPVFATGPGTTPARRRDRVYVLGAARMRQGDRRGVARDRDGLGSGATARLS